jgi:hypothetical protein
MVIITESGTATSLGWWASLRVEGKSVVVTTSSETDSLLVVAAFPSEAEAKAMFTAINQRISLKARRFDARECAGLICHEANDTQEGSGE